MLNDIRVLLVANDLHLAEATKDRLAAAGFEVELSLNAEMHVASPGFNHWSVSIVDLRSPTRDDYRCLRQLLLADAVKVIVLCTSRTVESEVADLGAIPYLIRPFCNEEGLVPKIKSILAGEQKPWRSDLSHPQLCRSASTFSSFRSPLLQGRNSYGTSHCIDRRRRSSNC